MLKLQNYKRWLGDMQLNLSTGLTSQLDLVVCSNASASGLTLHVFVSILGDIAKVLFQGES